MSNIQKVDNEKQLILVKLDKLEANRVKSLSNEVLKETLTALIYKMYALTSIKKDDAIVKLTVDELIKDLKKISGITISEVEFAFKQGIKGEYYGLNYASFSKFIADYMASVERKKVLKNRVDAKQTALTQNTEPSELEKYNFGVTAVRYKFEGFKKVGYFTDLKGCSYDFLNKQGLIKVSEATKRMFQDAAKEELKESSDETESKFLNAFKPKNYRERLILKSKHKVLQYLFECAAELDKDIVEFLKEGETL